MSAISISVLDDTVVVKDGENKEQTMGVYSRNQNLMTYTIPGRRYRKASGPVPPIAGRDVVDQAPLMFLGGLEAEQHHVWISTEYCKVKKAPAEEPTGASFSGTFATTTMDPALHFCGVRGESQNVCQQIPAVDPDTMYYWRVDAVKSDDSVETGDVWCFTVGSSIPTIPDECTKDTRPDWCTELPTGWLSQCPTKDDC